MINLKKAITTSAVFSIIPSIPIVIGVGIMMQFLGLAIPWIRLTVIGALQYEISAVFAVSDGVTELTAAMLVSATVVMTISILSGPLFNAIFYKKYQGKLQELQAKNKGKNGFHNWLTYVWYDVWYHFCNISWWIFTLHDATPDQSGIVTNGSVTLITLAVSMGIIALCGVIMKVFKQKWLENYALPLSILGALLVAFFVHPIFVPGA